MSQLSENGNSDISIKMKIEDLNNSTIIDNENDVDNCDIRITSTPKTKTNIQQSELITKNQSLSDISTMLEHIQLDDDNRVKVKLGKVFVQDFGNGTMEFNTEANLIFNKEISDLLNNGHQNDSNKKSTTVFNGTHDSSSHRANISPNNSTADNQLNSTRQPFPFLAGEILKHDENTDEYSIYLTNYRFYVKIYQRTNEEGAVGGGGCHLMKHQQEEQLFCLPINNIDSVEIRDIYFLIIYTKYIESFVLTFHNQESATQWHKRLSDIQSVEIEHLFCFRFYNQLVIESKNNDHHSNSNSSNNINKKSRDLFSINQDVIKNLYSDPYLIVYKEFNRMKFDLKSWRICELNKDFKFCYSYPQYFIVPAEISDKDLESVANFRYSRRIPVVVWRSRRNGCVILRSSQPVVGWLGWRSNQDERLLDNILKICDKDIKKCRGKLDNSEEGSTNKNGLINDINGNGYDHSIIPHSTTNMDNGVPSPMNNDQIYDDSVTAARCSPDSPVFDKNTSNNSNDSNNTSHSLDVIDQDEVSWANSDNKLLILDARSYTAAFANRAMGGGCECPEYYVNCDVQFMGLNNIHSIRKSFYSLRYICESSQIDQSNWFTLLDNTKWLHNLASLLKAAVVVVDAISIQERPVLVHCSDGWDRTPQVISLAELMLDPYYRTMKGFKILVEKEWLLFGHKFADRCRSSTLNIDPNERCPVFLQWVDCVHQLIKQFPHEFEFNIFFLMKLIYHSYSCLFGTFICNNVQERVSNKVYEKTISFWSYFEFNKNNFVNYLYLPKQEVLRPSFRVKDIIFWNEIYVPFSNSGSNNGVNSIISCNGICSNSNVHNSNCNCQHEIPCQSQSKCDLNRSASYESLYNCDLKLSTHLNRLDNNKLTTITRHLSDSCLFKRFNQIPIELDKFNVLSGYMTNRHCHLLNGKGSVQNQFKINSPVKSFRSCKGQVEQEVETSHHHNQQQIDHNECYKMTSRNNETSSKTRFFDNKLSTENRLLFDIDGQIIGKKNTQMQLEQLINYHKRMIRCLTYQLKFKKKWNHH